MYFDVSMHSFAGRNTRNIGSYPIKIQKVVNNELQTVKNNSPQATLTQTRQTCEFFK